MTEREMFETSFQRPKNYFNLSAERQWLIDEKLGILDWTGEGLSDEDMKRFRAHYGLKDPNEKKYTDEQVKDMLKHILWDYIKGSDSLKNTDFDGGLSTEFKSYKKTNITRWFNKNRPK